MASSSDKSSESLETLLSEILPISPESEMMRVLQYFAMRESGANMADVAEKFGYSSRAGMYKLIERWKANGVFQKAQEQFLLMKSIEIEAATSYVLEKWPLVLVRVVKIALFGSDKTALEAAAWLKSAIVDPAVSQKEEEANAEKRWAEKAGAFNPSEVIVPPHLLKQIRNG